MKILFVSNRVEIGGATNSMLALIKNLKDNHNVIPIVVSPNKKGKVYDFCKKNNIEYYYVKYFEIGYAFNVSTPKKIIKGILMPILFLLKAIFNKTSAKKLSKNIDFNEIDFIHTNVCRDDFGIYLKKEYCKPLIMHMREFGKKDFECKYLSRNIYKYFNKNVDKFIAISNVIKDYYIEKGIDKNKIKTIYNGIDTSSIKSKKTYNDKIKNIVISSGISKNKGQEQVIDALKDIALNSDIHLTLYGMGDNEYIKYLKRKIKKYNLNNSISFKGYCNNLNEELCNYDLAIMPSKAEAFGRVTVEYMLSGLPVIASDTGANCEIIEKDKSGLVYKFGDIEDLKQKINFCIENVNEVNLMAKEGQKHAKKYFTAKTNAYNINKLYEVMIDEKNK